MKPSVLAISMVLAGVAAAQEPDWSKIEVKVVPVAGGVSMLVGQGGNIGVTTGKDGTFLIDDQFAPLLPKNPRRGEDARGSAHPLRGQHPLPR